MILTTHHALGDGRNAFSILTQYIDILSNLLIDESYQGDDLTINVPSKNMEQLIEEYRAKENFKSHVVDIEFNEKCKKLS